MIALWLVVLAAAVGLSTLAGGDFNANFSLPGTDSNAAVNLLTKDFPGASGEGDQIVFRATGSSTLSSSADHRTIEAALAKVARVPGIVAVGQPLGSRQLGSGEPGRHRRLRHRHLEQDRRTGHELGRDQPDQRREDGAPTAQFRSR